jgi:phosphatidylglycerol:prolipoprotein diacylglycerol transferase
MFRFFGLYAKYPFLFFVGEFSYYGLNLCAIILAWRWVGRKLAQMGYTKKKIKKYIILSILISIPTGFFSSRAVGMFYYPIDQWSLKFLLQNALASNIHTFHGSLILPLFLCCIFGLLFKFRLWHILDTIFLYIPLAHAIGRVSCLLVGCCWGRHVTLDLLGYHLYFKNPIPLWAIGLNLCVYLFLKQIHTDTYFNPANSRNIKGATTASYLMLYGVVRLYMEIFRTEPIVFKGLTQAQVVMLAYIAIGLSLLAMLTYLRPKTAPSFYMGSFKPSTTLSDLTIKPLMLLAVFIFLNLFFLFLFHYLVMQMKVVPFPFQKVDQVAQAYRLIPTYLPFLILPMIAIIILRKAALPILEKFAVCGHLKQMLFFTIIGLAVSIYYSVDLLIIKGPRLRRPAFWPPVMILSLINASAEEITYRLTAYSLLLNANLKRMAVVLLQAILYASAHFLFSPTLGVLSLIYGIILGILMDRTQCVTLCILCHFIVDIGAIGGPMLTY